MKTLVLATTISLILVGTAQAKYKEKEVTDGGEVQGKVQFTGEIPAVDMELISKDNEICGDGEIAPNPITVGADGALQNVVVFIEGIKAGKAWPEQEYTLNQLKCAFDPYIQVVPKGGDLVISNSDAVLHNVHPYEQIGDKRRTMFNLAQPKLGQVNTKAIKTRRGQVVELSCDAHAWMSGWIYVLEHPYFAVVGADGTFAIDGVPAGSYTLKAWHPVLGLQEETVEVDASGSVSASFEFSSTI